MLKNRTIGILGLGFALFLLVGMSAYTATADTPPVVQDPVTPDRSQPEVRDPGYSATYMELLSISGQEFVKGGRTFFSDAGADPLAVQGSPRSLSWTPVRRVTVDPSNSQTLYAAIHNGYGIYRSKDGGVYWEGIFTGCSGRTVVFANDDTTALATLGDSGENCAVLRSDDGGNHWLDVSTGITRTVVAVAFHPSDAMHIYAATLGAGIYQTTNGGTTWVQTNTGLADDFIYSIAVCPSNPNVLYAGGFTWVYRSDDGGNTWYIADHNYPCWYTEAVAIRPSDCNTFYAGGQRLGRDWLDPDGLTIGGFFKSTAGAGDGNLSLKNSGMQDTFVLDIAQDPLDPNILYAGTWASGVFRSDNGGVTWQPKNGGITTPYVYSIEATEGPAGTVLYAGTFYSDAGLFKSTDRGENWTEVSQGSALYPVIFDAITTGSADNLAAATSRGTYWSIDGGQTWSPSTGLKGGEHGIVLGLAGRPTNPARTLAATYGGGIYASADAGKTWMQVDGYHGSDYVYDLAFRPGSSTQVYAGTYGVQSSSDSGLTWSSLGNLPDWVRALDALSGTHPDVFAATHVSGVYMSPDGNGNWVAINSGLGELRMRSLKATAHDTLFAGTNGSSGWQYSILNRPSGQQGQEEPAGVRGTDSWTQQGPYILAPGVIQIAIDPANSNRIYAGTDQGVYRSTNGGETWVPKNQGLGGYGDLVISGIAIDPNNSSTIYLATWGYGIFKSTDMGDHWVRLSDPLNSMQMYLPMVLRNYVQEDDHNGFDSQFNGSAEGWVPHSGSWYVDGNYLFTEGLAGTSSSVSYTEDFSDFVYEARVIRGGCDTCANRLHVRGTPNPLTSTNHWHHEYTFQYSRDGSFSVYKIVAGGGSTALQNWTFSSAINQGDAWNTLKVTANGTSLSFYINGTLVWSGTDYSLSSGRVGLGMYRSSSSSGDVFAADWAKLSTLGSSARTGDVVSAEQQALNDAANQRGGGSEDVAPPED
jgi:photosystem II stability/assembly factor-like uncharacterized protein